MNNLITILPIIASFFVIISGLYGFYKKVIKPRRIKTKFINLLPLIQEWFDELDCYLEKDLNIFSLQNKEKKIIEYIDKYLKGYTIKPSKKIIRKWNKKMGIKKELQDSTKIFSELSRIPIGGMDVKLFFMKIVGNFYTFYKAYKSPNATKYNYADIEMPIKFLKFYVENI